MDDLIESLRRRCLEKPGVTTRSEDRNEFGILTGFLDIFARIHPEESPPVLLIRCADDVRQRIAASSSAICVSSRMCWETEGWSWTDVVLDGSIPAETVLGLVDHSYQRLYDEFDARQRLRVSLLARGLGPAEVLSELLAFHGLEGLRPEIDRLARPAYLLRTERPDGAEGPPGRTRIGGEPDLPEGQPWPTYRDGRPLAFLAQVNLSDLPEGPGRGALPARGLLSLFSVWGWQDEGESDPEPPDGGPAPDWTRILLLDDDGRLRRHPTPEGVNAFPAAAAEPVPIVALPNAREEPDAARLGWDDATWEAFSRVAEDYHSVCSQRLGFPAWNLLLGYADYVQSFVDEVAARDVQLLFQIASDENAGMCWGDGGYLYFWADPRDIARGDFTRVVTDFQCG